MDSENLERWRHSHQFGGDSSHGEKATRGVALLTACMMVAEIVMGWRLHSMALLADGWHMGTHVLALGVALGAYMFSRRYRGDARFTFGTGKIPTLAAYTSALGLGAVGVFMAVQSAERFFVPLTIHYNEAIAIAAVGLGVNVLSAFLLQGNHSHGSSHHHGHGDGHHHAHGGDLNLRAVYLHVIADAFTSVLAIVALAGGKFWGWVWLDPAMGIVGSAVVIQWSWSLLRQAGTSLLDRSIDEAGLAEIREAMEADGDALVADLHAWRIGPDQVAVIVSLVAHQPKSPEHYRSRIAQHEELVHVTIEVNPCDPAGKPLSGEARKNAESFPS